jgi:hypothetical protein
MTLSRIVGAPGAREDPPDHGPAWVESPGSPGPYIGDIARRGPIPARIDRHSSPADNTAARPAPRLQADARRGPGPPNPLGNLEVDPWLETRTDCGPVRPLWSITTTGPGSPETRERAARRYRDRRLDHRRDWGMATGPAVAIRVASQVVVGTTDATHSAVRRNRTTAMPDHRCLRFLVKRRRAA